MVKAKTTRPDGPRQGGVLGPHQIPKVLVVAPSGPRYGGGSDDSRNANLGRIRSAYLCAHEYQAPLLISGRLDEIRQLQAESARVREQFQIPQAEYIFFGGRARNTHGNVGEILAFAFTWFGLQWIDEASGPNEIIIHTQKWHAPRVLKLAYGMQMLLMEYAPGWQGCMPFTVRVVGVDSDDLAPDFWQPYAKAECSHRDAPDFRRLREWREVLSRGSVPVNMPTTLMRFFYVGGKQVVLGPSDDVEDIDQRRHAQAMLRLMDCMYAARQEEFTAA